MISHVFLILIYLNLQKTQLGLGVISINLLNTTVIMIYDLRKYNFTNRVIPIWNSLPNHVVSAETVNTFKQSLDKFWIDQDVMYNYKADLHGIGNRSIIV